MQKEQPADLASCSFLCFAEYGHGNEQSLNNVSGRCHHGNTHEDKKVVRVFHVESCCILMKKICICCIKGVIKGKRRGAFIQRVCFFFDDSGVLHKNEGSEYFVDAAFVRRKL